MPKKLFDDSVKLAFKEWGNGQPLILLHGFAGGVHQWHSIAEALSLSHRVIVPSLSHFYSGRDYLTFSAQVEHLLTFIQDIAKKYGTVNIAGVSYGAALAWAVAIREPELLDRIVFINPMPQEPLRFFKSRGLKWLLQSKLPPKVLMLWLISPFGKSFLHSMASIFRVERLEGRASLEKMKGKRLAFVANLIQRFAWIMGREYWPAWKNRWVVPSDNILLIHNYRDPLFHHDVYYEFIGEFDVTHCVELAGEGHMALVSHDAEIREAISAFLHPAYHNQFLVDESA